MTVSTFKKKEVSEVLVPTGAVVYLSSDTEERFPMTIMESKAGKVYCRWFDDPGNLQGDRFFPAELLMEGAEEEVDFKPEFEVDAK
jgi:uncharacterized protein YodC (DUF2158 family)